MSVWRPRIEILLGRRALRPRQPTLSPAHALWGLLHDASEAYLVDLPRPLKLLPEFAAYREAERRLQRAVAVRFGLPSDQPASVTEADDTMLWIEAHSLLGSMPVEAERLFLNRFKELTD